MTKLRKQRRKKVYRAHVNRKRLRNKIYGTDQVKCKDIQNAWEHKKSAKQNLEEMGLVYDPNTSLKKSKVKEELTSKIAATSKWTTEKLQPGVKDPPKKHVSDELEREANAPRQRTFEMPNSQVQWVTYLLDKYGSDYKAMARDRKNYYQETPKQIRAKVKLFMGVPKQYAEYLQSRGLLDNDDEPDPALLIKDEDSDGEIF